MDPISTFKTAWLALNRNKLRTLLTELGVIIGVAAVIIMIAISAGTEATIKDQITALGSNLIYVQQTPGAGGFRQFNSNSNNQRLVYDDALAISQKIKGVAGVVVDQTTSVTVKAGSTTMENVTLVGTSVDFPRVREMHLSSGRYFTETDISRTSKIVVLGHDIALQLYGNQDPIGQLLTVGNTKLTVIGVFAVRGLVGNEDFDARLYTPITVVFSKFLPAFFARVAGNSVRMITVQVDPNADLNRVINLIALLLAKRKGVDVSQLQVSVRTQEDLIQTRSATTATFRSLLTWVAAVSLLVGGIGIMNIMLVSVTERTREIGIRQSVGAAPIDIRWQFLTEAMMLSLIGGLIGVVTGIGGSILINLLGGMRTVIVPSSILLAFSSAAIVGIFFGYYPANQAAMLDPIEALRHE
jgi:putative ABC transport system permease protein